MRLPMLLFLLIIKQKLIKQFKDGKIESVGLKNNSLITLKFLLKNTR